MKLSLSFLTFSVFALAAVPAQQPGGIAWQGWSDDLFVKAQAQKHFVLLDLEAVWCHWCHVMDETTYRDPQVISLLKANYTTVRVDQDSRPDLSSRYEDYGWPATIVFDSKGKEIVRRRGYIPPKEMISMLKAINADPSPGPSVIDEPKIDFPKDSALPASLRATLEKSYLAQYDSKKGAWGFDYKYLDADCVEYSMILAQSGDAAAARKAKQTLSAQLALLDPAWGGMYQYSTGGDWKEPHFEKIMSIQTQNLRVYALAYQQWGDPVYLKTAEKIHTFLRTFLLSPDHAFYTSQDADVVAGRHSAAYFRLSDEGRRKLGVPPVDKHIYARENGWVIDGLATLYAATGDEKVLREAMDAADWIQHNRGLEGGGFRHDQRDASGPYLGDTLAMARAFLNLYSVTGDRQWLARAESSCRFIARTFGNARAPGYLTSKTPTDHAYVPKPQRDENAMLARFANLLFQYTGRPEYRQMAEGAMRYLAAPAIATRFPTAAVLIADRELAQEPVHLTIVGPKNDPTARALFLTANHFPAAYKRLEWWDHREGELPRKDVNYPELKKPALFVCTATSCSPPAYQPEAAQSRIKRLLHPTD